MTVRTNIAEIAASSDPKRALMDAVERLDLDSVEVAHNLVLVATYIAPDRTEGGIFLTDQKKDEDRFQGKAALVLKLGPLAFRDDGIAKFGGFFVQPGDWVMCRPSDGLELFLREGGSGKGTCCRLFEDTMIKACLHDPSIVW